MVEQLMTAGTQGHVLHKGATNDDVYWAAAAGGGGGSEINDLSSIVTWANVPNANITQSSVTQHQAALTVTESQISDLSHTVDTTRSQEEIEDFAGGMMVGTETRITVTYQDATGDIDFVVDDMNDDVPDAGDFGNAVDLNANGEVTGGDADTAVALAANGANCAAGNYPLGVDASGAVESCTGDDDVPESGDFGAASDLTAAGALDAGVIDALNLIAGALCGTNQILEDQGASWACIDTPGGGGGGGTTITTFQVKDDGTTGQLTTGTAAALTGMWATPEITDGNFTWNGTTGVLTVNAAGTLELNVNVCSWNNANNRHEMHVQIQEDTGGGFGAIHEASTYTSRNNTQDEGCVSIPGYLRDVASGDDFRLMVFDIGVAATVGAANVSGETYISAKLYE